jgi:hypothetical protein
MLECGAAGHFETAATFRSACICIDVKSCSIENLDRLRNSVHAECIAASIT